VAFIRFSDIKQWCDHVSDVTVNPDDSRIIVFNSAALNGLIVIIPIGGQAQPVSVEGVSLLWKNVQKKALVINRSIPSFNPF